MRENKKTLVICSVLVELVDTLGDKTEHISCESQTTTKTPTILPLSSSHAPPPPTPPPKKKGKLSGPCLTVTLLL